MDTSDGAAQIDTRASGSSQIALVATSSRLTTGGSKMSSRSIPSDKVRLDVLLITGQRRCFDFDPQRSIKEVRETLWTDWPEDWPPRPISSSAIRILHLGHILDDKFILAPQEGASGSFSTRDMPIGKSTVVHLLLRQEPTKIDGDEESLKKVPASSPGCCNCIIC